MTQTFTSARTSINSAKLPAVYNKAPLNARIVFDYGCGKYIDHIKYFLVGRTYLAYDPYNQPRDVNEESVCLLRLAMQTHCPVDVVCSNVLNVIDCDVAVEAIAKKICDICETTGGKGYITVYEGDRSSVGRQTGADQYQRNAPLRQYLRFFRNATIQNGMIVVG